MIYPGLELKLVAIQVNVQARVELVVFVSATGFDPIVIEGQSDAVMIGAVEVGIARDDLKIFGQTKIGHGDGAKEVALGAIALASGEVAAETPPTGIVLKIERNDMLMRYRDRIVLIRKGRGQA